MSTTQYPPGTHFSDGIRTGAILGPSFVPGKNILSPSSMVSSPLDQEPPGIFNAPITAFTIIPSFLDFNIIFDIGEASPGFLELTNESSAQITILKYQGVDNVIQLDCARNLTINGLTNSTIQSQFDIYGWDQYGIPLLERIAGPVGIAEVQGKKAFSYIRAIFSSGDTVGPIAIGVGNTYGLPYLVPNRQAILSILWQNQLDNGVFVPGDQSLATATSGDVRGTYTPSSGANGTEMLSIYFYNWSGDAQNYNLAGSGFKFLKPEPFGVESGESIITVEAPNHQLILGEQISISGATGFANISADQLNITTNVTAIIDQDNFQFVCNGVSNVTDPSGGGSAVKLTPGRGNLYSTYIGRFGVKQFYPDTQ